MTSITQEVEGFGNPYEQVADCILNTNKNPGYYTGKVDVRGLRIEEDDEGYPHVVSALIPEGVDANAEARLPSFDGYGVFVQRIQGTFDEVARFTGYPEARRAANAIQHHMKVA